MKKRLLLGIGLGWEEEEFVASGATTERRGARLQEYVSCLDAIFTGRPDFAGEHYRVPRSQALPRPAQEPRPPVLLGGVVPAALKRAGRIADGWVSSSRQDLRAVGEEPGKQGRQGAWLAGGVRQRTGYPPLPGLGARRPRRAGNRHGRRALC